MRVRKRHKSDILDSFDVLKNVVNIKTSSREYVEGAIYDHHPSSTINCQDHDIFEAKIIEPVNLNIYEQVYMNKKNNYSTRLIYKQTITNLNDQLIKKDLKNSSSLSKQKVDKTSTTSFKKFLKMCPSSSLISYFILIYYIIIILVPLVVKTNQFGPIMNNPQTRSQQISSLILTSNDLIAQQGGIIKDKNITLTKKSNPIIITKDIIIRKDSKLTIEPGTEILFDRKRGILVRGVLEILGKANDKVKLQLLKSVQSSTLNFKRSHNHNVPHGTLRQSLVRLVDGELPNEGRVQIWFKDRWHSLCTGSKNLTSADMRVLCRQVGFQDGHWYRWFPRRNDTIMAAQMMSKSFYCAGTESTISECKRWNRIRTGGGICDYHSDIGLRCSKTLVFSGTNNESDMFAYDYWRGLEFTHSETTSEYTLDGQMKQTASRSIVKHVIIREAGLSDVGNATAAIRVFGQPPRMEAIEVRDSIYGIMIEDSEDAIKMNDIYLTNNLANPLFINTSWGQIDIDGLRSEKNGGDGIRIVRHEKMIIGSHDFCKFANLGPSQSYPVILSHEQTFFTVGRNCCQEFFSNDQLTVHFQVLRSTPNNLLPEADINRRISIPHGVDIGKEAHLIIYDDYREEFPFKLKIVNGTRAQSIVSKSGRLKICYEPASYRTVLFTIQVVVERDDEWSGRVRDVDIRNSLIKDNDGRGIWIDNQRSGVKIINTTVLNNNYMSGIHIENGTGEVIIQASTISNNTGHGVFINLAGGYYHIDNSTISDNLLKGILIDYDKRPELNPFNHTFHLGYSLVARNGENGLFIGNVCRSDAHWNISMNSFVKNGDDAIEFTSCNPHSEYMLNQPLFKLPTSRLNLTDPDKLFYSNQQEFSISHNIFYANLRRAIHLAPVFYLRAMIRHNLFKEHNLAVLFVNNQHLGQRLINSMNDSTYGPVYVRIASNRFYNNRGRYVANIGLQEDNPRHSLVFTKNTLENNVITEPYVDLKPRSRVSAVVAVSSSNSKVTRNRFNNPLSAIDVGSHLEKHSKVIDATINFWGHGLDATSIYRRIFDRKNRYNLAQVEFLQYLLSPEDLEYATDLSFDRERDKISHFKNGSRLGGEVKGYEELDVGTYQVQDDIFVRPGAHLIIKPGTILKFHDGVGMMVQGRLDSLGTINSQILYTSIVSTNRLPQHQQVTINTPSPLASPWISYQPEEDTISSGQESPKNLSSILSFRNFSKRQVGLVNLDSQNVRLSHRTMGKLEVQIDGYWGSVCDYNFDINDASVVCQQLGMILNRDDWLLEKFQYAANDHQQLSLLSTNVLMTNVRCDPNIDTDITKCKAEVSLRGDFDGMCSSEVGMRCFPPSWSGIRLGMSAEVSTFEHSTIQRAGMFDYASHRLKPALQIDFNRHVLHSLMVKNNADSGLGIIWNDVLGRHFSELTVTDSKFSNNERHGIELKSRGLTIKKCSISSNQQSGLDYSPSFSTSDLDELMSWLPTEKNAENIVELKFPLETKHFSVPSSEESYRYFIFPRHPPLDLIESFTIATDPGHMLSIQLLNQISFESTENLNMSTGIASDSPIWDLRLNTTSFPMVSPSYKFHFNYTTGKKPWGQMVLYIRSRYNNRDLKLLARHIPSYLVMPKFEHTANNINARLINSFILTQSNITKNGIGLRFRHPNYPYGPLEYFNFRFANETTNITGCIFDSNYFSSISVSSDHYEPNIELSNKTLPASEIYYNIIGNKFQRNRDGIRQFSRDIRQTHNVFHWTINDTSFISNRGGGVNIVLPFYLRYDLNLSHTMQFHNNSFLRNSQFEFAIDGHFSFVDITRNIFKENKCRESIISVQGMEKVMYIGQNIIEENSCDRIVELSIHSHADKMGFLPSHFELNSIRLNHKGEHNFSLPGLSSMHKYSQLLAPLHPLALDHAMSLRGVQMLNITRNLFVNPDLRYELVVAVIMDLDERPISAIENYWGAVTRQEISNRIFDFDDWNNFAVVDISPFLIQDSFTGASAHSESGIYRLPSADSLGGRLMRSMILTPRANPYLVTSDLTVMPNVTLVIERGVTIEFMPNVGILVLGELIAMGTRDKPILMRPSLSALDVYPLHEFLRPPSNSHSSFIMPSSPSDPLSYDRILTSKQYQLAYSIDLGSIRLCKNEICNDGAHIYDNNVEDPTLRREALKNTDSSWKMDGFLEVFNMTTLQWVPVCDPLFTHYAAKVVCRQLGFSHSTFVKRGRRYTIEQEQITSVRSWFESVQCEGHESNLANCPLTPKGSTNHSSACVRDGNQFVYIHCQDFPEMSATNANQNHGTSNEHVNHWGGIRFSCPAMIGNSDSYDPNHIVARNPYSLIEHPPNPSKMSRLQYVSIDRAGMLHRKKSPAVQVLQCPVQLDYVAVTNSAHHGVDIISSLGNQNLHHLRLRNNLGVGLNYLSLAGSSSANRLLPYLPLKHLDMSSDIFGLADICGANKEIKIGERLLLFYRYNSQPTDCIKIISSKLSIKHIGIRMLQFDIYNSTAYTSRPDSVKIYDGNVFDRDSRLIVDLGVSERHRVDRPELKFYQTSDSTMSVVLHASGANPYHGFIAEVVTTPVSFSIRRDTFINMTYSEITNNKLGAMNFFSAGESTSNLVLKNNRFESNCMHLFGNFTSCINPVYMELQNCQRFKFGNNLVKNNQGGLMVKSFSHTAVSALEASIENNVFEMNQNTNTLAILGPKTDPYQTSRIAHNIFTRNYAPYLSNIVLSRVLANFSHNIISGNVGRHQIEVLGFDKLPFAYQTFDSNWIYNNTATYERDKSTIFGTSAGQTYRRNYIVNADNSFEISTMNWSRYDVKLFHQPKDDEIIHLASGDGSTKDVFRKTADAIPINIIETKKIDLYHAAIDAKNNWWGFNTTSAIQGRVRDRFQYEELIKVDFAPFLESNRSLLNGICAGGWQKVGKSCLVYIGVRMNYMEAKDFCDKERATLPLLRGNHEELTEFIKTQDLDYDERVDRVWVRSFDVSRDSCPAMNDYWTRKYDCIERNPFLCERNPVVVVSLLHWYRERGGLIAATLTFITAVMIILCSLCWGYKSRERQKEKLVRKNSIHASMRSNRGIGSRYTSNNSLSESYLHRQIYNPDKASITDLSTLSSPQSSGLGKSIADKPSLHPNYNVSAQLDSERLVSGSMNNLTSPYTTYGGYSGISGNNYNSRTSEPFTGTDQTHYGSAGSFGHQPIKKVPRVWPHGRSPLLYEEMARQGSALNRYGSRTPSSVGSQTDGIIMDPMPVPPPQPPLAPLTYSQIDYHAMPAVVTNDGSSQFDNIVNGHQLSDMIEQQGYNITNYEGSDQSTVPTYYSNKIDVYRDSTTTESFIETYQNIYNGEIQRLISNEQMSHMVVGKVSLSDPSSFNNSSRNLADSGNPMMVDDSSDASDGFDNNNLVNMDPRGFSMSERPSAKTNGYGRIGTEYYPRIDKRSERPQTPSMSEYGLQQNINRYCVETNFDLETPTMAPTSTFGSSQRLSPVSSIDAQTSDSKLGSRVYLETSFE